MYTGLSFGFVKLYVNTMSLSLTVPIIYQYHILGHVEIKIKDLPASGSNTWWSLYKIDGKVQKKDRGEVHLIQHLYIRAGKVIQHTR